MTNYNSTPSIQESRLQATSIVAALKSLSQALLIVLTIQNCDNPGKQESSIFRMDSSFSINTLQYDDLYYSYHKLSDLNEDFDRDENGVILYNLDGEFYYHPVQIFHKAIEYHDLYHITEDSSYLAKSIIQAMGLLHHMDERGLLAYNFPHRHGDETMAPPWYSAMAQGQALTIFSRLFTDTQDQRFRDAADLVFYTLLPTNEIISDYPLFVDDDEYLWLEEYPQENPDKTLNGFLFAIFGIYDYTQITHSTESINLLKGLLTTIKDHIELYRVRNNISFYCLKHQIQDPTYHKIHIAQLRYLSMISDNPYFEDMATLFISDYWDY